MSASIYTRLLLLMAFGILLLPLLLRHPLLLGLLNFALAVTLVLAVWQSRAGSVLRVGTIVLAALTLLTRIPALYASSATLAAIGRASTVGFLAVAALFIIRELWEQRRVGADTIVGALAGYLLLGLLWAAAYALIEVLVPGSFRGLDLPWHAVTDLRADPTSSPKLLYFSFVTLTTLGYGDLAPASPAAAALAVLEAVTGQLYVAVVIARLVALSLMSAREDDAD